MSENTTEEPTALPAECDGGDEDSIFQAMYDAGGEDAAFINDFEETLIEVAQESPELASCYATYLEARTRLKERARVRGFWPMGPVDRSRARARRGKMGQRDSSLDLWRIALQPPLAENAANLAIGSESVLSTKSKGTSSQRMRRRRPQLPRHFLFNLKNLMSNCQWWNSWRSSQILLLN